MFEIGDYVSWHEEYSDGIAGRDFGDGIIIDSTTHKSSFYNNLITTYKVYRNKHKDFMWFEKKDIKIIGENDE